MFVIGSSACGGNKAPDSNTDQDHDAGTHSDAGGVAPDAAGGASTSGPHADSDPAGIFDGNGHVNVGAYQALASQYGTAAMIPFRFGHDSTFYNPTGITSPTVYARPIQYFQDPKNTYSHVYYTLGTPVANPGDFSSNEAQVAYVTDPSNAASTPGVDRVSTLQMSNMVYSNTPQLNWVYDGWGNGNYGRPEQDLVRELMAPASKSAFDGAGGMPAKPIEVTRAYGAGEAAGQSLLVFQNGTITAGGTSTAAGTSIYYRPFPAAYVPTAASVTNTGEFALITLWDTEHAKAKLAVLALGGSQAAGAFWGYEWTETYPGFRNYSYWNFMKLLGYVDLPDMIAPTAVEAVGDMLVGNSLGALPSNTQPGNFPLSAQANWSCFATGGCKSLYDHSGFALVASRYEKKVTVVDLRPLFQHIERGMFTDWATFRKHVANTGMADAQWPEVFAVAPDETPTVVRTLDFDGQVTAISASLDGDDVALVATEDGTVHVYDVGGLQTGGSGANMHELRTFQVGRNVTRLAHMKHAPCCSAGAIKWQYIAMSRGDKRIDWIDLKTETILRTLKDSRLVDPITVEDNNNHGTKSDALEVGDFGAKKIRAYRYGPVIFDTNGGARFDMGPTGSDAYEYSGDYDTPTGPFSISIENVT